MSSSSRDLTTAAEYQALDTRVVRIQRRERLLKMLLLVQLVLNIGTPVAGRLLVFPESTVSNSLGKPSTLFFILFIMNVLAAGVGLVAVYMQRSASLLISFILQIISAGATVTAMACTVVYIEIVCQLISLADLHIFGTSQRVDTALDNLMLKYFCNSTTQQESPSESDVIEMIKSDRHLYSFLTILYSIILAILAATVAYTALQLRFDILKAKYYHRRGWRGLFKMFSRGVTIHDNPHRLYNASRELRDTWERAEEDKPPALRRQVYSLINTDAKYRSRALTLTFLLDRAIHRKKVILDIYRRRILLESLLLGRQRSIYISRVHAVKLLAEVSDGEGSITSLVQLTAERRVCCGPDRVRRWELQFALHLEALRFCQLVQALASRPIFDAAVLFAEEGAADTRSPLPRELRARASLQIEPATLGEVMKAPGRASVLRRHTSAERATSPDSRSGGAVEPVGLHRNKTEPAPSEHKPPVTHIDSDLDRLDTVRGETPPPMGSLPPGHEESVVGALPATAAAPPQPAAPPPMEVSPSLRDSSSGSGKGRVVLPLQSVHVKIDDASASGSEGAGALAAPSAPPARPYDVVRIRVGTWNMGAATPDYERLGAWLQPDGEKADLYAVGVQECVSDEWHELLGQHFGSSYVLVAERAMGQIKLSVFVHRRHAHAISAVETSYTPTGVLGIGKNKGGVALALQLRNTRLCFVNSHLAAHQDKVLQRNQDVRNILKGTRLGSTTCELTTQFHTIWLGDLNYRVEKYDRKHAVKMIEQGQLEALAAEDQLTTQKEAGRAFHGFVEAGDIAAFPPTYKLAVGNPMKAGTVIARGSTHARGGGAGGAAARSRRVYSSEKNRVPAWCDRVLLHELEPGASSPRERKLVCTAYGSCDALTTSDHAPVGASLELRLPPPISESEPLYQCVIFLDCLASQQLDVGDALGKRGGEAHARHLRAGGEGSTLKLHAHLPCLHAELGKRCLATCPASWAQGGSQLECGGARLVVGQLIVQPSFLAEQHVLLRLVDWSQGHPSPLGSGNISLEAAVDSAQHPTSYENQPFSCHLNLNGRPVGVLTGQLHVIWSGTNKPTKPLERSKSSRILSSPAKHFLPARAQTPRATRAPAASLP